MKSLSKNISTQLDFYFPNFPKLSNTQNPNRIIQRKLNKPLIDLLGTNICFQIQKSLFHESIQ